FENSGRMRLDTPEAHKALEFYRTLLKDASAMHPDSQKFDSGKSGYEFAAGEVAMMVNWFGFAFMSETIPQSKVRGCVGIAPIPSSGGPPVSFNGFWGPGLAGRQPASRSGVAIS